MQINVINSINTVNNSSKLNNQKAKEAKEKPLRPLDYDFVTFTKKKDKAEGKKAEHKIHSGAHSKGHKKARTGNILERISLALGQKRALKIEAQANEIKEDAQDAISFSYVGDAISHSKEIITEGYETNGDTRTTSQIYSYEDGVLVKAELEIAEDLKTGTKNTRQIFEFEKGEIHAVYENVVENKDGTRDFSRKYEADEEGHLQCVYNKVL